MITELIVLLLAIPSGYLIAWLARDELVDGRKWFLALIILSFIGAVFFYFYNIEYIGWTCGFVVIISFVSLMKSYDKKWIKKKFK